MAPAYEQFYDRIKITRPDVVIGRIESETNDEIANVYDIHSFPKVVIFFPRSEEIHEVFEGDRTVEELEKWLEEIAPLQRVSQSGLERNESNFIFNFS